jgi:putative phage-type endonuclease
MIEVDLEQGSPEWKSFRINKIGASEASIILGLSPYMTRNELYREKMGLSPSKFETGSMRFGKDKEEWIRDQMSLRLNCNFQPKCFVSEENEWAMCSVDGIDTNEQVVIEIKCTNKKDHELAKESGIVPEKYFPQLQHILYVTDYRSIWYCSYHQGDLIQFEVQRDGVFIEEMIEIERRFWESLQNFESPEINEKHKEFTKEEIFYVAKEDEEWKGLASTWKWIQDSKKEIEKHEKEVKDALISLSGGENAQGYGLKLTKRTRIGAVDYSSIIILKDIDLEEYRKESTTYWEIK